MLVLAPVAVIALVAVSWLAGGWRTAALASADAAWAHLAEDAPELASQIAMEAASQTGAEVAGTTGGPPAEASGAARVLLASDGRAALLASASGEHVAAVVALGDRLVTRHLAPGLVRSVTLDPSADGGRRLCIVTRDVTCRRIDLHIDRPSGADAPDAADAADASRAPHAAADALPAWMDILERLARVPARAPEAARAGVEA